jgi:hypothetical protein
MNIVRNVPLSEAMDLYFQGEKIEALVFILPIGLCLLVFGAWLLTDHPSHFTKGVAIPLLAMGMLMGTVGAVVGYRTPGQVLEISQSLQTKAPSALEKEEKRMAAVNKAWHIYLTLWLLFGFVGLQLRLISSSDFLQGLGIALVFCAGLGLLVDGFAQRRALPYHATLQSQPQLMEKHP